VPRDIMVIIDNQLQNKVEKNTANVRELVRLTSRIVDLIDLAPAMATAAAKGGEGVPTTI
ncbi:hypothetical protein Tco_0560182, partial [Tanacetum coccineum]